MKKIRNDRFHENYYEETLDNMAGTRFMPSRRNRIKAFI